MSYLQKYAENYKNVLYFVFRLLVGGMFFIHGAQKLFGWFGGSKVPDMVSLMGVAGLVEFFGGLLVVLGLFTRLAALVSAVQMFVAYFMVHFSMGSWNPVANKGELALLYGAAFLVLFVYGNQKWNLEQK
ncbi:DoxX family protein, partial [Candidatus Woesearchaeota archaeon]|nr:DoxX family protein [Candidatus Woesearchaeota archaeon]